MFEFIHWPLYSQYTCRGHGIQTSGYGDIRMLLERRCVLSSVGAQKGKWASLSESGDQPSRAHSLGQTGGAAGVGRWANQESVLEEGTAWSGPWKQQCQSMQCKAEVGEQACQFAELAVVQRSNDYKQVSQWEPVCTALWEWTIPRCLTLAVLFLKLTWQ